MPSPVGHALAGFCGFALIRGQVAPVRVSRALFLSFLISQLPDLDILPGLLVENPSLYHHKGTHSLVAALIVGLLIGALANRWKLSAATWAIWGGGLYLCQVFLDMLVDDPSPPLGVQLLWPFSEQYYIAPFTPFERFDYGHPTLDFIGAVMSSHNLGTALREVVLMAPFVGLAWYLGRPRGESADER